MTTLVALATKDALVMGSDSLGTVTRQLVDPFDLLRYFNAGDEYKARLDDQGRPLLARFADVYEHAQTIPYNQLANVRKLFSLDPLPLGVMFTGITSIGDRTIGGLVSEFRDQLPAKGSGYTVETVAQQLHAFLRALYDAHFTGLSKPPLELLIGGYDDGARLPCVWRIDVQTEAGEDQVTPAWSDSARFGIAFGGQMDWIQRIVFGTDVRNQIRIHQRSMELLRHYRDIAEAKLRESGNPMNIVDPDTLMEEMRFFKDWSLDGLDADWGDFSEQNAIECVDFFIDIMIRAQAVSSQLPTVGGDVHVAVIRSDGFRFVSREEWSHGDHRIKIPGLNQ